jgi:hypothetical protein
MKTAIENNSYFACLALEDVYGKVSIPEPIKVGTGTWVSDSPPVELDAAWSKWLGSLREESWKKSKVVILAKERSRHTSGEDVQTELRNRVFAAFYSMLLQGAGYSESALLLEGEKWKKELSVQSVQDIDGHRRTEGQRPVQLNGHVLRRIPPIAVGLRFLYAQKRGRLKRGFEAWEKALREQYAEDRLHQLVRALEAVVKTGPSDIGRKFTQRATLFVQGVSDPGSYFQEMWKARSKIEHVERWQDALGSFRNWPKETILRWRAIEAEILVGDIYSRILESKKLRELFVEDTAVDGFWGGLVALQRKVWGNGIEIEKIARKRSYVVKFSAD